MIPKTREAKSGEEGPEQGSIAELRLGIEAILSALREQWLWEEIISSRLGQQLRGKLRAVAPPLTPRSGCARPVQARLR